MRTALPVGIKKDFLVPCDWLKNQRAVIMPPCPRYESEEEDTDARIKLKAITLPNLKPCYGKCNLCIWKYNGGCSEWNGWALIRKCKKERR